MTAIPSSVIRPKVQITATSAKPRVWIVPGAGNRLVKTAGAREIRFVEPLAGLPRREALLCRRWPDLAPRPIFTQEWQTKRQTLVLIKTPSIRADRSP